MPGHGPTLFSATPPLEATRGLISRSASDSRKTAGQIDINKAHVYGLVKRRVAVKLHPAAGGEYAFLQRTVLDIDTPRVVGKPKCDA